MDLETQAKTSLVANGAEATKIQHQLMIITLLAQHNYTRRSLYYIWRRGWDSGKLANKVLELAHEGQQGLNKTKSLLREKVWFPRIDAMVAKLLDACIACNVSYVPNTRGLLVMTEVPSRKWSHLCADL